jgi:uncharacterized membrane protein YphA (DoxX/SURF4 family)
MKISNLLYWVARLVAAAIMLQTLYFKFSGAEESVHIFTAVGMEPWGRIGVGVMELIASVLLLIQATVWVGSVLGIGLMGGAISMHLLILGIEVDGDGGTLFIYALLVLLCSFYCFWKSKSQIPDAIKKYLPSFLQ